ncbi:biotin/lipoate A/B protein ligase family protein [Kocuria rhizophila]|uniref:lipoate--protein ligase family protein n=1 Tax=Kocuria rhizophila TaxID=72000 RepID=UPI0011A57F86|nr:biotin/lipoate A/B protein ligase family protein [Kocuria rhizophila]WTI32895.1 lipoate--protein ligase family protein [Kocuria rhizophila]
MTTAHAHGEYKVQGGKLVVADLTVTDHRLTDVSVNGDFFLEPDEALADINAALTGLHEDTSAQEMTERIQAALPAGAVLFGFDARAVVTAVRRALGRATTWSDHAWEVVPATVRPTLENLALDEVLAREVGAGHRPPTLRFWDWDEPAVVIGSFQSVRNEVDPEGARRHGVQVVRRVSGGGAMFMEAGNCITYSLYLPQTLVDGMSFAESYPFLDAWVMQAFAELGVEAFYVPLNDIATPQGKIGGAAQKRFANGGMVHHVTMSYDIDAEKMTDVLRIGQEKISDKGIRSAKKRVDPLRRQTGMPRQDVIAALSRTFTDRYGATAGAVRDGERTAARKLIDEKFGTHEWIHRVP